MSLSSSSFSPDTFPPLTPEDLRAGFSIDSLGHVTVDGIRVSSVAQLVNEDHFYLLSLSRIVNNTREYQDAVSELLPGISCILGYAIKANANLTVIRCPPLQPRVVIQILLQRVVKNRA
jgi:hypothetical protein